jgi:AcrR family transcriptional regulator
VTAETAHRAAQVKRRTGGRSARVRATVLAAATEVLAETGYERFSFEEVATRAGVHKTTLHRRWKSKAELVLDALHARSELIIAMPNTGRLAADLVGFLRTVADNVTSAMGRSLVLATISTDRETDEVSSLRHRFWEERFDRIRQRLERAKATGELAADTDTGVLAEALVSPIYFRTFIRGEPLDEPFLRSLVHQLVVQRPPQRRRRNL